MKKLLYSGLMALMMLFAMPGIVRADGEGGEGETTTTTLPTPTFTPSSGNIEQGARIVFNLPEGEAYRDGLVAFCYVFDDNTETPKELKPTGEELQAALMGGGEDLGYYVAAYTAGQPSSTGIIPLDMAAGEHTMRVRMAFVADMAAATWEVTYSEGVGTATYTVAVATPAPQPVFTPETGASLAYAGTCSLSIAEDDDDEAYWIYYVVDDADFDFSSFSTESAIKAAGAKQATKKGGIKLTKGCTIRAAACKSMEAGFDDDYNEIYNLFAWSEPVSATYTVAAPQAPVFDPVAGAVAAGTKVTIKSNDNPTTTSSLVKNLVDIYYTTDGTTEPTKESPKYTEPIEITAAMTIKAIAIDVNDNTIVSAITTAPYTIKPNDPDSVTVTLSANTWQMGNATVPTITAAIENVTTGDNALAIGSEETNVAVMVVMMKDAVSDTQFITGTTAVALQTAKLTAGEWTIKYALVKGNSTAGAHVDFDAEKVVIKGAATATLTVTAATPDPDPETLEAPSIKNAWGMPSQGGYVAKGTKVSVWGPDEEGVDTWYTVDGTTPAADAATATKAEEGIALIQIDSTMTIKAIAVKGTQVSEVVSATFKLVDSLKDAVVEVSAGQNFIFGKNVPITLGITSEEYPAISECISAFYYTLDGTTEPSMEAYEAQEDKENGAIKAIEFGSYPLFYPTENPTKLKVKGYAMLGDVMEDGYFTAAVQDTVMAVESEANPVITVAHEGELVEGDTIVIKNTSETRGASVYFSLDGTPVTSMFMDEDLIEQSIFFFDEEIKIAIEFNEANVVYEAVFEAMGEEYKIELENTFTVQAICYSSDDMMSRMKGSDNVTAKYTLAEKQGKENPKVAVTIANNGTMGNDEVVTFNGPAKFTVAVSGIGEDDNINNYTVNAAIYGQEDYYTPIATVSEEAAEANQMELLGLYDGEYSVEFFLERKADPNYMQSVPEILATDTVFNIKVTNYPEPNYVDPTLTVAAAGKNTMNEDTVVFDGMATFNMDVKGELAPGDSMRFYHISADIYTKYSYDTGAMTPDVTSLPYDATDKKAEFAGIYNGEYVVVFKLFRSTLMQREPSYIEDTAIYFNVTNYTEPNYEDPTLTVAAAGKNTMNGETVVFDGMATFNMDVKGELAPGDSMKFYHVSADIYTKAAYDADSLMPDVTSLPYDATDKKAEFAGIYNGEYVVVFNLFRSTPEQREPAYLEDTAIYFNVTNYPEPNPENSELTVEPVGATKDGENYVFASGEVAFDMFVKDMVEGDSLFVSIYTKKQYDTMGQVEPTKFAVADSVRFTTTLEKGEYVGDFTIVRKNDRGEDMVVGEAVVVNFTVGTVANEAAELAGVNVYPNPNAGTFNVAVPERARIDIFGLNGAKVMSREVNAGVEAFQLNHSGIYFVRVMAGNKTAVKRVVVR